MHLICHDDTDQHRTIHILNARLWAMNDETISCMNVLLLLRHTFRHNDDHEGCTHDDIISQKEDLQTSGHRKKRAKTNGEKSNTSPKHRKSIDEAIGVRTNAKNTYLNVHSSRTMSQVFCAVFIISNVCIALWWSKHLSLRSINCFRGSTP